MRICLSFIYVNRKIGGIAMKNNIFTSNKTDELLGLLMTKRGIIMRL